MKTFVINLDKNVERMKFMSVQLSEFNIQYERISATYGAMLTKEELRHVFSSFRSLCASGYRLRAGEIGCALSHCRVYYEMLRREIPISTIFEDDVIINSDINNIISMVDTFSDRSRPQVYLLSSHSDDCPDIQGIKRVHGGLRTDGYVITLPAAKLIYDANCPVITVADKWERWEKRYGVEMYRVFPASVRQANDVFGTDISQEIINYGGGMRMVSHKILRVLQCSIDHLMYLVTGR